MSNSVYPTLSGAQMDVTREVIYGTVVQSEASGRELRISQQAAARYRYRIRYDFVRESLVVGNEAGQLFGFYAARRGVWDSFLFTDPYDNTATLSSMGTGDGTTATFYAKDVVGDRIGYFKGSISVYKNGVLQTLSTHYTIDATERSVTFVTPPTAGHPITWTGEFYQRVRFANDALGTQRRFTQIWATDVEMISVLG